LYKAGKAEVPQAEKLKGQIALDAIFFMRRCEILFRLKGPLL